uniref:DEAD/SNF2-like helicase n=1 Tax=Pithovirus LCPAC304 TaxID=2506594 RepID=A0A481Z8W2_9VIRU|nr:MAG: DEAD/SNF2-like helicase [Pithovirus LCPAC304]
MSSRNVILAGLNRGTVRMRPYQIEHCIRLVQIIESYRGYLDTSNTGSGKTWSTIAVAMYYNSPILVIGPKGSSGVWNYAVSETGVEMVDFITKDALRSRRGHQPKHGYLDRDDTGKKTVFTVTKKFMDFVAKGGFVVIDECQSVRNSSSDQHKAAKALLSYLVGQHGRSRFALLSATPLNTIAQIVNLMRLVGYINKPKLFRRNRSGSVRIEGEGLEELFNACADMDAEKTQEIKRSVKCYNTRTSKETVHQLFRDVIKYHISSAVVPPKIAIHVDRKNGYYNADDKTQKAFMESLEDMKLATRYQRSTKTEDRKLVRSNIITQRRKTELIKASVFARIAKEQLLKDPTCKVIVGVHYLDTLEVLKKSLSDFKPIVLQGSVKGKDPETGEDKRDKLIRCFQTDPKSRLILAIVKVIAESISLHDTIGDSPRFTFLSPSYELLLMHQACGRTVRDGDNTKSDVTIRFVYLKDGELEAEIYAALARKSQKLKDCLIRGEDVVLPNDFEMYRETAGKV